jgi:hypothetical protein
MEKLRIPWPACLSFCTSLPFQPLLDTHTSLDLFPLRPEPPLHFVCVQEKTKKGILLCSSISYPTANSLSIFLRPDPYTERKAVLETGRPSVDFQTIVDVQQHGLLTTTVEVGEDGWHGWELSVHCVKSCNSEHISVR